jgi:hypothetical protein
MTPRVFAAARRERSFDWVLTIFMSGDGIRLISVQGKERGEMSDITVNAKGEMQFQPGSQSKGVISMHPSDPARQLCVWARHMKARCARNSETWGVAIPMGRFKSDS